MDFRSSFVREMQIGAFYLKDSFKPFHSHLLQCMGTDGCALLRMLMTNGQDHRRYLGSNHGDGREGRLQPQCLP